MTREQKLAWAKAHGVTPPAEVQLAEAKSTSNPSSCESKSGGCCARKSSGKSSCCSKQAKHVPAKPQRRASEDESRDVIVVSQFLGCQGIALVWMQLQVTLPGQVIVQMGREPVPAATLVMVDERTTSVAAPPDAPPPRIAWLTGRGCPSPSAS